MSVSRFERRQAERKMGYRVRVELKKVAKLNLSSLNDAGMIAVNRIIEFLVAFFCSNLFSVIINLPLYL